MEDLISVPDSVSLIRKNLANYLGDNALSLETLADFICADAKLLGAENVEKTQYGSWMSVLADRDWIKINSRNIQSWSEVFNKLISLPEAGVNTVRHEIYLIAFTANVVICESGELFVLKGELPSPEIARQLIERSLKGKFIVAFSEIVP